MATQPQPTAREQAIADRDQHETSVRMWVREKADSQLILAELLERSAGLILDNPAQYDDLAMQIGQRQAKIAMADRVISEACQRYSTSQQAALLAEAAELEPLITAQQAVIAAYDAETEKLLAPLVAHTGRGWSMDQLVVAQPGRPGSGLTGLPVPNDYPLHQRLEELQTQQAQLRTAADNVPPLDLTDELLARASIRLAEVTGEIDDFSRRNIDAVSAGLRARADELDTEVGGLVWELKQGFEVEWHRLYGALPPQQSAPYKVPRDVLDHHVVTVWEPTGPADQALQLRARAALDRQGQLQAEAALLATAAPVPVGS